MLCILLLCPSLNHQAEEARSGAVPFVSPKAAATEAIPRDSTAVLQRSHRRSARLITLNGVATLEVDGAPFLLLGAQCDIWRSTRQDEKTLAFFDGYQAMNATAVSVGVPWSKLEPSKDVYDFRFLDWFIQQARQRRLKLVVNLFNSNICGKVQEGASPNAYPQYTPDYILHSPQSYQRMILPGPQTYDPGGPPMCPNDPRTLERERLLCAAIAEHLKLTDRAGAVILLQLDNEFYYQQWAGVRPADERSVRCHCLFCEQKWRAGSWKDGEEFMFQSFAQYVRVLTDAIVAVHPLPVYINSPWWPPRVIPAFLEGCPNLALVGVDGVFSPIEPNMLSRSQVGRNIAFATENPTENPQTRANLDVLPYYTLIGQLGIGNLLWECGPPHTVVEDPQARQRFAAGLYPIHEAAMPIARARGSENLAGWFALREIASEVNTDVFGNFIPTNPAGNILKTNRWFVREGRATRIEDQPRFTLTMQDLVLAVSNSAAGIIVRLDARRALIATPGGSIEIRAPRALQAARGRFVQDRWKAEGPLQVERVGGRQGLRIPEPTVVLLKY